MGHHDGSPKKARSGNVNGLHGWGTTLLCAASGCDHHVRHAAPFQMVFLGLDMTDDEDCVAHACVSMTVTGDWKNPCSDFEGTDMCSIFQLEQACEIDTY